MITSEGFSLYCSKFVEGLGGFFKYAITEECHYWMHIICCFCLLRVCYECSPQSKWGDVCGLVLYHSFSALFWIAVGLWKEVCWSVDFLHMVVCRLLFLCWPWCLESWCWCKSFPEIVWWTILAVKFVAEIDEGIQVFGPDVIYVSLCILGTHTVLVGWLFKVFFSRWLMNSLISSCLDTSTLFLPLASVVWWGWTHCGWRNRWH